MPRNWSNQIESRYGVQLTPDLRVWFDQEIWRTPGGAEFREALTPEEILAPNRGQIWAGFMLPDTLPLIGNGYGDWICMRIGAAGNITEFIRWNHAGGDWMPVGATLGEALLYDAAIRVMYDRRPEFTEPEPPKEEVFGWAEWARSLDLQQTRVAPFWNTNGSQNPMDALLSVGAAVAAARHDRVLKHLDSRLKKLANPKLAGELQTAWEPDFVSWIFDNNLLPASGQEELSRRLGVARDDLVGQRWDAAEREALAVCRSRKDLGWAFDIAGWAAERRGDTDDAVQHYLMGVRTSLFADDTVSFRTHWYPEGFGKFAAARLHTLRERLPSSVASDAYLHVLWENEAATLHRRLSDYWIQRAGEAESAGDTAAAYRRFYNAGWDLGLTEINGVDRIFHGLSRTAKAAGWHALAHVAAVHRSCL